MISFSCKARSGYTDSSISYIANNPGREKKRRTIWHNSFLNLQKWALIARTEMFFWKKTMFFKCRHSKQKWLPHKVLMPLKGMSVMRCLLTPETSSVSKMSLVCMKNNEQCIMNLSLGHNPGLRTCNQTLAGDAKFCLSKKLLLNTEGTDLSSPAPPPAIFKSFYSLMNLLSPLYLFVINAQSYQI